MCLFPRRYGPEPEPDVHKWLREHGESTGRSDLFLVVTEGGEEIKIPVSRGVLAFSSGLVRDLPNDEDVPIIGDHTASTVVAFCKLCYPRTVCRPNILLRDIAAITRLAHWMDAPDVVDLLFGQLTVELEENEQYFRIAMFESCSIIHCYYASKLAPDFYRAIFAMKDAGKEIKLHQYLIMHFPNWYIPLSDAARAPYVKHSSSVFADFMTEYGKMKDDDKIAFSSKHLVLSRYLLSFYPGTPGGEGPYVGAPAPGEGADDDEASVPPSPSFDINETPAPAPSPPKAMPWRPELQREAWRAGDWCIAIRDHDWHTGSAYYGLVAKENADGTFAVHYDDGHVQPDVRKDELRCLDRADGTCALPGSKRDMTPGSRGAELVGDAWRAQQLAAKP